MKLKKMKEDKKFALTELSFSDLKAIKDSCLIIGKNGSPQALKIGAEIEKLMGNISI